MSGKKRTFDQLFAVGSIRYGGRFSSKNCRSRFALLDPYEGHKLKPGIKFFSLLQLLLRLLFFSTHLKSWWSPARILHSIEGILSNPASTISAISCMDEESILKQYSLWCVAVVTWQSFRSCSRTLKLKSFQLVIIALLVFTSGEKEQTIYWLQLISEKAESLFISSCKTARK